MNDDRTDETTWLQVLKPMVFFAIVLILGSALISHFMNSSEAEATMEDNHVNNHVKYAVRLYGIAEDI